MTMREFTAQDIKNSVDPALINWDFKRQGRMRVPLRWERTAEGFERLMSEGLPAVAEKMYVVEVRLEQRFRRGRYMHCLIGHILGTSVEAMLAEEVAVP